MKSIGINTDTCSSTNFIVMTELIDGMIIAGNGSLVNGTIVTIIDRALMKITILFITKLFIAYILKKERSD